MPRPLKVFLCHASQDKPAVRKMYFYLKQHGIQPWLDREDLLPGQDWEVEIPKAIFTSDVILVCLSANSVNKEGYVQKEIAFALDKAMEKPQGTIFIIPVKLEECIVPSRLSRYQWVDYYRPDGRKKLLMGLNMRVQGLGEDVSPVIMEDSRQRATRTQPIKEEVLKEPKKEPLVQNSPVAESRSDKLVQAKPFTRILDPSKLAPQKTLAKTNTRPDTKRLFFGLGGLALIGLFFLGLYVFSPPPSELKPTSTPTLMEFTKTPKPSTATHAPATNTPQPTPTLGIGSTMVSEKDGMVMVYVPAGEFTMGSDAGNVDEQPVEQVYLEAFWIDQTEVTNGVFSKFVELTGYQTDAEKRGWSNIYYGSWQQVNGATWQHPQGSGDIILADDNPVIHVSWNDAIAYCKWAGRDLPTEAQWEKAARSTDGRTYPWGEGIDCNKANYDSCVGNIVGVGSFLEYASIYGALDMTGNVWEWVRSLYRPYPYETNDGREDLKASGIRGLRGGSWYDSEYNVRSTLRYKTGPTDSGSLFGFRCALSQP